MSTEPTDIKELVARLEAPIGWGGVNSEDGYDKFDPLRVEAAALIRAQQVRIGELEAAKWQVKHVDTMNDMVSMGMARDAAEARTTAAEAERDKVRAIVDLYFAPWGAAKTARWEGLVGDVAFDPENALEAIRAALTPASKDTSND